MLLAVLAVLAVVTVPLAGGRITRLADVQLRHVWVLAAALLAQIMIISVIQTGDADLNRTLHLATYVAVLLWIALNTKLLWRWGVVLGGLLNFLVIVANNGVMPASRSAQVAAGLSSPKGFENSAVVADPNLAFLGDIFAIPKGWPFANVFSIGDALLIVGIFLLVHRASESYLAYQLARLGDRLRGRHRHHAPRSSAPAGPAAPSAVATSA